MYFYLLYLPCGPIGFTLLFKLREDKNKFEITCESIIYLIKISRYTIFEKIDKSNIDKTEIS